MKRVLVVEDSRVAFELLRRALTPSGKYSVEYFSRNGEDMLEIYAQYRPDIVTMDITMNGVNGVDMTRKLISAYPDARVVMVTSMAYQEVLDEAMNAGAVGYIHKPFHPDQVISAFDKALQ